MKITAKFLFLPLFAVLAFEAFDVPNAEAGRFWCKKHRRWEDDGRRARPNANRSRRSRPVYNPGYGGRPSYAPAQSYPQYHNDPISGWQQAMGPGGYEENYWNEGFRRPGPAPTRTLEQAYWDGYGNQPGRIVQSSPDFRSYGRQPSTRVSPNNSSYSGGSYSNYGQARRRSDTVETWQQVRAAIEKAQTDGVPLVIQFTNGVCGNCEKDDSQILDPMTQSNSNVRVLHVLLDVQRDAEGNPIRNESGGLTSTPQASYILAQVRSGGSAPIGSVTTYPFYMMSMPTASEGTQPGSMFNGTNGNPIAVNYIGFAGSLLGGGFTSAEHLAQNMAPHSRAPRGGYAQAAPHAGGAQ